MEAHIIEWLNLTVRWVHVIVGIAWIGASFYFVWLENNLDRRVKNPQLAGELWAIHGGGIYHLQKYKLAPETMPKHLHWFKWEAYSTWLSGVLLLIVVFYLNADIYLLANDAPLSATETVALGVAGLIGGWLGYDVLCKSPLRHQPAILGLVLLLALTATAWGLSLYMSGRAAYIHLGAIIGTMMVGNVFFVIMPAQRSLVAAVEAGDEPDPSKPKNALLRSRHNNYLTLPVLFIMISNHFPSTYGNGLNWLILLALAIISVAVRHYFNTRHNGQQFVWVIPAAVVAMIVMAYVTAPTPVAVAKTEQGPLSDAQAQAIISTHCGACHAAQPSHVAFVTAPAGVVLDDLTQSKTYSQRIYQQAVVTQVMPLGNTTKMTELERQRLGQWLQLQNQ
ncbi:MAG: urate hydroxylase PuuD [Gammaproteobacteria bacterium]|nr:urate hydroxylase PuuD [Gammaproteobacteria bacterium]MCP4880648.1 urate hydroxylase PuuD [Gammaproteobacteria bacterium]